MTPLLVSLLASGTHVSIKALPMFVSIIETVIFPVAVGFLLNYLLGKKKAFAEAQKVMPGIAVLGLAFVVGGVVSSQGSKFFTSGVVIFAAVLLHNGLGYLLGYGAGKLVGMNTAKKRTISIEVGMQNAGLATNLATTTAQFASTPESAIICAVSCTWHSISGTLFAGAFALKDKMAAKKAEEAAETMRIQRLPDISFALGSTMNTSFLAATDWGLENTSSTVPCSASSPASIMATHTSR